MNALRRSVCFESSGSDYTLRDNVSKCTQRSLQRKHRKHKLANKHSSPLPARRPAETQLVERLEPFPPPSPPSQVYLTKVMEELEELEELEGLEELEEVEGQGQPGPACHSRLVKLAPRHQHALPDAVCMKNAAALLPNPPGCLAQEQPAPAMAKIKSVDPTLEEPTTVGLVKLEPALPLPSLQVQRSPASAASER